MRKPQLKYLSGFDDCQTMEEYNRYMKQRGFSTPIHHEHLEKQRSEAYLRVLENDALKFKQQKKVK